MKKLSEFDSLEDFGYKANINDDGGVEFIKCDDNLGKTVVLGDANIVYADGDLSTGKFFTLENILSGGTIDVVLADSAKNVQADIPLDYSLATSLAYLGSVYSVVMIGINKIKDTYPNGFEMTAPVTGITTVVFNTSDTNFFGAPRHILPEYTDYELVQAVGGVYDQTFAIDSGSTVTGGTYAILFLDGTPETYAGYTHFIQPKTSTLDKFYASVTPYELDLLVPPVTRTNFYPRHIAATNCILFSGSSYDTFVESEQSWATLSDNEDSNFIWRKLYPDGQKVLDSEDDLMQKMVLTIAANFDKIKKYQDGLKYQHTIGYDQSEHISKDLVELLASQWNWGIGHNLKQDDYSEYIYSQYDNYITGLSEQRLSSKDVNFEMWRRVLANITTLYKKKGTKEGIKYIANMYGLPESLLWIEELVNRSTNGKPDLIESESNVTFKMSGDTYYINSIGSAVTFPYENISNTKYLNVNISPISAIEYDLYDWGQGTFPDINGVTVSSTTEITQNEFFQRIYNATIESDGSARYASSYPLLEGVGVTYYAESINKFSLSTLEPYLDFLDDNWSILITDLVPASSRLLSVGGLYKNPMWRREKHQWIDETVPLALPFNEDIDLPNFVPTVAVSTPTIVTIETEEPTGNFQQQQSATIDETTITSDKQFTESTTVDDNITETGTFQSNFSGTYDVAEPVASHIASVSNLDTLTGLTTTLSSFTLDSPYLELYSGQGGTSAFTEYSTDSVIVTNDTEFDVIFSAANLSDSGYTQIQFELFRREYDENVILDEEREYSILNVEFESETYGIYRVSNLVNLDELDFISVESDYLPYINQTVQVSSINTGSSTVRTTPAIGLLNLPTGEGNSVVDWGAFIIVGTIEQLRSILNGTKLTHLQLIDILEALAKYVDGGTLSDATIAIQLIYSLVTDEQAVLFDWWFQQEPQIIYGALLLIEFLNGNKAWTINSPEYVLVNMVSSHQTKATFKRIINFFNWKIPVQTETFSNYGGNGGDWNLPTLDTSQRVTNDFVTTGTVTLGGLDSLNANVLVDKAEYFYRYQASTHAPISWGEIAGVGIKFPIASSGGTIVQSGYELSYLNDIKYYGRYFLFMNTPKVPIASVQNLDTGSTASDASISVKWNGVGDSDRLQIQYVITGGTPQYSKDYSGMTEAHWTSASTTINLPAKDGVGDEHIYTIQTTLDADTYYWWRIKNFRNKVSMFGHNLEYYSTTEPSWFKTGGFSDSGTNEGEITSEASLPSSPRGGGGEELSE